MAFTAKTISATVRLNRMNSNDVRAVQELINGLPARWGGPTVALTVDGDCKAKTADAIRAVQKRYFAFHDGEVDPKGPTLAVLNEANAYKAAHGAPGASHTVTTGAAVTPQPQSSALRCWATAAAMLLTWREGVAYTPAEAAAEGGPEFTTYYDQDLGLVPKTSMLTDYLEAIGMYAADDELTANSPHGWKTILADSRPVGVVLRKAAGFHVRVVTGLTGDGTLYGTDVQIVDPDGGRRYSECFRKFGALYTETAKQLAGARLWKFDMA
jgi:hypothetical protein